MGLQGEVLIRQIRLARLQLIDQGDQLFAEDPGMKLHPNVGIGLNYIHGKYSFHISIPRLLNTQLSPYQDESSEWSMTRRILYLGAASSFEINDDLQLSPSILFSLSKGMSPLLEDAFAIVDMPA